MTFSFLAHDFIQSGTILSIAQSPPPITFPARAEETLILEAFVLKNALQYPLNISSAEALDVLYGSIPPRRSFSE